MVIEFHLRLLGGFSLTLGDRPLSLSSGRSQLLLAYLALHPHTPQSRQRLAFLLWPDSSETQARSNLRKELSYLRKAVPQAEAWLLADTKTLQWGAEVPLAVDVRQFEAALQQAEQAGDRPTRQRFLEDAIALYQGEFLPDFENDWVVPERERLRQGLGRALDGLIALLEEQGKWAAAIAHAQHLLRLDNLNEAAYGALMRLYGASGDRASALQLYHQCMTLLRDELGVEPSAATRKVYEQILREDAPSPPPEALPSTAVAPAVTLPRQVAGARSPLVGREAEWAQIQAWAGACLQGGSRKALHTTPLLLLQGEPGIGKTRLLEELTALAQENQVKTLWGQGFAAEMMRPYGIWIDGLRGAEGILAATAQLPADLGLLLPELGQPSQRTSDLSHLLDAVVQLLMQWAKASPLLIVLDDIQWMDDASSALLHYALRLLRPWPVWVACSARAGELASNAAVSQVLQALRREQQVQVLEVVPLDREQTADLVRSTGAIAPATLSLNTVNQVFIDSGGNPLFALEIARALSHSPSQPTTQPLDGLIRDRLQQLDEAARDFLPWAAALGRSFHPTTVAQIADYPMMRLLTAIEQLEQQGLIRPSSTTGAAAHYDFAHDIVRQVVYQQLSEPRRHLMHWQIAQKLQQKAEQDDTLVSEVAYHAGLAGDHALAATAALAAAERCLRVFAYTEALEMTQRGLHHSQFLEASQRLPLQGRLRGVQVIGGMKGDRAEQLEADIQALIEEAKALGLVEAEAIALEALIVLQFERSNYGEIPQHTQRVTEASQLASPATAARMLARSGSCLAEIGRDMRRAEALLVEAQSLADRVGLVSGDLLCGLGCMHRHHGRYSEARAPLQQAWQLARRQQNHWLEGLYLSYLAMTEIEAGHPEAALPYCQELTTVAAKIQGDGSEAATAQALEVLVRYHQTPNEASTALIVALETLEQVDAKRMITYVSMQAALVDLTGDRPDLAVQRAEVALSNAQIVNQPSFTAMSGALWIQGLVALDQVDEAKRLWATLQRQIQPQDLSQVAQDQVERAIAALERCSARPDS